MEHLPRHGYLIYAWEREQVGQAWIIKGCHHGRSEDSQLHCGPSSSKCCMQVFDLMGYPPCHYNKINIHIGGIYDDKEHTIRRFAENFNTRLSPNLQSRLTVENDDRPNSYSMTDLLLLHNLTGIPLVSAIGISSEAG